jgi:hypothetical protein
MKDRLSWCLPQPDRGASQYQLLGRELAHKIKVSNALLSAGTA